MSEERRKIQLHKKGDTNDAWIPLTAGSCVQLTDYKNDGTTTGEITNAVDNNEFDDLNTALMKLENRKVNSEDLATVATSGSYNDLTDKPQIEATQSDWSEDDTTSSAYILHKPEFAAGDNISLDVDGDTITINAEVPDGPMKYMGTVGVGGTKTADNFPAAASANKGHSYKVITDGTYQSIQAYVGDLLISTGSAWTRIPSGDDWKANTKDDDGYVTAPKQNNTYLTNKVWKTDGNGNPAWRDDANDNTEYEAGAGLELDTSNNSNTFNVQLGTGLEIPSTGTDKDKVTLKTAAQNQLGGVKTTSNVASDTGYTACPIINGVVYYKDENTTYNDFGGATAGTNGSQGLVPQPTSAASDHKKFLKGSGGWTALATDHPNPTITSNELTVQYGHNYFIGASSVAAVLSSASAVGTLIITVQESNETGNDFECNIFFKANSSTVISFASGSNIVCVGEKPDFTEIASGSTQCYLMSLYKGTVIFGELSSY